MFKPLSLYIGLRYTRAKRRNGFISFISLTSLLGIALGVAVLITVLSVMNGFDTQIRDRVFSLTPGITVNGIHEQLYQWEAVSKTILQQEKSIQAVAPFVQGQGLLRFNGIVQPALVMGIVPRIEKKMNELDSMMVSGHLDNLKEGEFGLVLGGILASNLGLSMGDKVTLIIPRVSVTPAGVMPVFKRFTIVGIFHAGNGFGFDSRFAYIHMQDAQKLFLLNDAVSGLNLKIDNIYAAPMLSQHLQGLLPDTYVSNWTDQYGAFFKAVQLEKTMMFLILTLIIAVAAFNLVSTLVMVVTDKQADIAILRTLGATPKTIMLIFMVQGTLIGFTGTLLGVIGGVLLALNVTGIVNVLQNLLHTQLFSSSVYFLDYLPSQLDWSDLWHICAMALILSLLATIYPAWKASKIEPAEALRYE
jgi:lipoprotein-releasing system permease protein